MAPVLLISVALVGIATALLVYAIVSVFASDERRVSRRLASLGEYEANQLTAAEPLLQPFSERVVGPTTHAFAEAGKRISPAGYTKRIRQHLVRAGHPRGLTVEAVFALKVVGAIVFGTVSFLLMLVVSSAPLGMVLFVVAAILLGFYAPDLWLSSRESNRKTAIRRALPDVLDMLTISVEAGLGFDSAVAKVIGNSTGPLAEEFARMLQEVQAGIPRVEAFRNLSERTDVPDVNTFVTSMVQADVFGISVSTVLRNQAKEMRTKRRQYAEEQAQKAPVKIVFPLITCILPATLIVIMGPGVVSIARAFGIIQ
jgi:tight adherence protein C